MAKIDGTVYMWLIVKSGQIVYTTEVNALIKALGTDAWGPVIRITNVKMARLLYDKD